MLDAYQLLQNETCSHCGHPVWLCRNEDVQWDVRTDTCFAEKEQQSWEDSKKDKNGKSDLRPGEHAYTVPFVYLKNERGQFISGEPDYDNLPGREDYYKQLSED